MSVLDTILLVVGVVGMTAVLFSIVISYLKFPKFLWNYLHEHDWTSWTLLILMGLGIIAFTVGAFRQFGII